MLRARPPGCPGCAARGCGAPTPSSARAASRGPRPPRPGRFDSTSTLTVTARMIAGGASGVAVPGLESRGDASGHLPGARRGADRREAGSRAGGPRRRDRAGRASGVCGSDLHIYHGRVAIEPGFTIGHEYVGEVVAVGDDVTRRQGRRPRARHLRHRVRRVLLLPARATSTSATTAGSSATASSSASSRALRRSSCSCPPPTSRSARCRKACRMTSRSSRAT